MDGEYAAVVYVSHSVGSSEMIWVRPVSTRQILDGDASERVLRGTYTGDQQIRAQA